MIAPSLLKKLVILSTAKGLLLLFMLSSFAQRRICFSLEITTLAKRLETHFTRMLD